MNRKMANITLGLTVFLWMVFCLAVLLLILFKGDFDLWGWRYISQVLISLITCIWLEIQIWKTIHNK